MHLGPPPRRRSRYFGRIDPVRAGAASLLAAAFLFATGTASCRGSQPQTEATTERPSEPSSVPKSSTPDDEKPRGAAPEEAPEPDEPEASSEKPHTLETFFRALADAEASTVDRRVRILHVGDSHTASDTITGRIRTLFQDKFGSAGRGYAYPGIPWRTFRQEQMSYDMSGDWDVALGIDEEASAPFALGGLRIESDDDEAWLERGSCGMEDEDDGPNPPSEESDEEECRYGKKIDGVSIFYLKQPEGGSFTVTVDGGDATLVETAGRRQKLGIYRRDLEPGKHRIRIQPKGDGRVSLFGIRTRHGRSGIEYSSLGLNGAKATQFVSYDADLTERTVAELDPDLIIVAFGTNTAFDLYRMHREPDTSLERVTRRLASYQFEYDRLLERYTSAAPQASCLVMLPPDTAPKRDNETCRKRIEVRGSEVCIPSTIRNFEGVVAAQRAAARRHGCAIWNQSKAMGGEGSMRRWSAVQPPLGQSDGVHLTMDGYHLLAEAFFSDVMRTYEDWRGDTGDPGPLETRTIDLSTRPRADRRDESGPP